jgi:NAD(P)-dependent dehydrogenase (short-subunit alcohol dehydrogenase family)
MSLLAVHAGGGDTREDGSSIAAERGGVHMAQGRFEGKVAIITGAARGLGRSHARLLADGGAKVLLNDLGGDPHGGGGSSEPVAETVEEIVGAGGDAVGDVHDIVTDGAAVVDAALDRWGRVDIVINNAGISGGGPIDQITPADYDRMIDVHYRGAVSVLRAAWPAFRANGYGRVVNTSSGSVFGVPWTSAYISAKAALIGLTRALALDGKSHGIMVNAIMPIAWTRLTKQVPDGSFRSFLASRFDPDLVAPFVGSLVCDDVPCTGEVFSVGGGIAARVFLGMARGFRSDQPSVDDYLAHFDDICNLDGFLIPANSMEEVAFRAEQLGIDFTNPTLGNA